MYGSIYKFLFPELKSCMSVRTMFQYKTHVFVICENYLYAWLPTLHQTAPFLSPPNIHLFLFGDMTCIINLLSPSLIAFSSSLSKSTFQMRTGHFLENLLASFCLLVVSYDCYNYFYFLRHSLWSRHEIIINMPLKSIINRIFSATTDHIWTRNYSILLVQ